MGALQLSVCALAFLTTAASTADARALDGLAELLQAAFPNAPESSILESAVSGLGRAAARENMPMLELTCARDYSACPAGWADLGDGAHCKAPLGFEGLCDSIVQFGGLAPIEKNNLASRCGAVFPCAGARPADYSAPCPALWSLDSDGDCFAPAEYTGPCISRKRFLGFTQLEKSAWAIECGAGWPERD